MEDIDVGILSDNTDFTNENFQDNRLIIDAVEYGLLLKGDERIEFFNNTCKALLSSGDFDYRTKQRIIVEIESVLFPDEE